MKYSCFIFLFFSLGVKAQIFTQSPNNGSITITPKGVLGGESPSGIDPSNVSVGSSSLFQNTGTNNTAVGFESMVKIY